MQATQHRGVEELRRSVLRDCRERISPEMRRLGLVVRRVARIGRRVTQEEVAEAADVSREWYARLEAGRAVRASPMLLDRLADTLMMDDAERRTLFSFAIPELRKAAPDSARMMADEMGSLRTVLRRLWAASSQDEVFETVLEDLIGRFSGIGLAMVSYRVDVGRWEKAVAPLSDPIVCAIDDIHGVIRTAFTRFEEEEWNLCGSLTQPGEVGFVDELIARSPLAPRMNSTIADAGLGELSMVAAHLRATDGVEANFAIGYEPGRGSFSEADVALIAVIAEFASFALGR